MFNLSQAELNEKLNGLSRQVQQTQSSFGSPTKKDWDDIFELCAEIAEKFKNVRFATKSEREAAWQKFYSLRNSAFNIRKSQTDARSNEYYNELMNRLKAADYSKLSDVIFGGLSFGAMKTTVDDMKSQGHELKKIGEYFKSIKYEMTKEHSAAVRERMIEVREHHNDFWGRYKSYQVEKQRAWEERKKENERKQKEWEAKQKEREQKKREWEIKQKEWEARKIERERKQREWEERKAERERKQREWEQRKADNESRRQSYQENKRNRGGGGKKGGSGGCYITTATCLTLGKDDYCQELMEFRKYRDTWLTENYPELIKEYYIVAPTIVDNIDKQGNRLLLYNEIWSNYLAECFQLIKASEFEKAKELYVFMVKKLHLLFAQ